LRRLWDFVRFRLRRFAHQVGLLECRVVTVAHRVQSFLVLLKVFGVVDLLAADLTLHFLQILLCGIPGFEAPRPCGWGASLKQRVSAAKYREHLFGFRVALTPGTFSLSGQIGTKEDKQP
jgi:hypothetical protein